MRNSSKKLYNTTYGAVFGAADAVEHMTKFKQTYQDMIEAHRLEFVEFKSVHDRFVKDRREWSKQFHSLGAPILEIMREYEQKLCASMERGRYAQYSNKVSEKFWDEVKKNFSHIELVGVKSNFD